MAPLRELSRRHWCCLRDQYRTNWPFGVEGYCFLDMLIKNPGLACSFNIKVYCPKGDIQRGMIAVSDIESYHLYICPITLENILDLEEALLCTTVIDWSKDIIIPSVMPEVMKVIDRIGEKLKMEVKCNGFVIKYLYNKDQSRFTNMEPPLRTHIAPLKCEDLDVVDNTWAFHSDTSKEYFRRLMDNGLTYVLYSDYNIPLAWVNVDVTGALCHLFSIEGCRRQGYGAFVTKTAINNLLLNDQHVLTYALADNFTPQKLFVRLGFENLGLTSWVFMSKKKITGAPSCSYCQEVEFQPS